MKVSEVVRRDEAAVGVDQCLVQLAAPVVGLFAQVSADNVMQHYSVGVLPVVADQSQISQALAVAPGLKC